MNTHDLYHRYYSVVRLLMAAALGYFAWRVVNQYLESRFWPLLLVLLAEVITIVLVLLAPRPKSVTLTPRAILSANAATFYFLVITVKPGAQLIPPLIPGLLIVFGIVFQILSKITLGRSFGILPALRRVVDTGPYRMVRHPIYFGYFCTHVGFFLVSASWHNLLVYAGLYACQVIRILDEERVLSEDPAYMAYKAQVRWRLVPGIF